MTPQLLHGDAIELMKSMPDESVDVVRCLMASCPDGGVVLDPFMGSGTTGVAIARCSRGIEFIGIDRELEWVEVSRKRMAAE